LALLSFGTGNFRKAFQQITTEYTAGLSGSVAGATAI
jgi:hypothetical protein